MNADIRHRLLNYNTPPPAAAWNTIATALDESPNVGKKLHDFEVSPPAAAWNNIAQKLTAPPKVVPLQRKLFQIAIAAAALVAVATGSFYLLQHGETPNLARQNSETTTPASDNKQDTPAQTGAQSQALSSQSFATENSTSENSGFPDDGSLIHFAPRVRVANNSFATSAVTVMPEEETMLDTELADRYMIATTPTGKAVRLPKKAYSDYACAVAYNNYQCKEKIASIQNKMAASDATDFTDFIDLLKNLQDNP